MGPIVKQLASDYSDKSIKFVTFDFTSDSTKEAAKATAEEIGVAATYSKNEGKTGFVLLYDTKSSKIVTKLSAGDDTEAWKAAIDKGLGG